MVAKLIGSIRVASASEDVKSSAETKMATIVIVATPEKDGENDVAFGKIPGLRNLTGGLKRLGGFPEETTKERGDRDPVAD
jgi:hypothetical protein